MCTRLRVPLSQSLDHYYTVYFNTETQWEKPDSLLQVNSSEQTAASSEEQTTYHYTTTASSEGVKRCSSGGGNSISDGSSEVKRPYGGRGYCQGGPCGSWTVVTVR